MFANGVSVFCGEKPGTVAASGELGWVEKQGCTCLQQTQMAARFHSALGCSSSTIAHLPSLGQNLILPQVAGSKPSIKALGALQPIE
jgi:hypothetical protein